MKKTLFKVLLGIVLACVLYISFLLVKYNSGILPKNLESDIRTEQHIDDAWIVNGSVSDTMAAFISYPEDKSDHIFSVYVKPNNHSFGYFFHAGGSFTWIQDWIHECVVEGSDERALISMNTPQVSRVEIDDGDSIRVIAIDSTKPFAIVLPANISHAVLYDVDGNEVAYVTSLDSIPDTNTRIIPTLDQVERMMDASALTSSLSGLTKKQLRHVWGEPIRTDRTYPLDVWSFEDCSRELIITYGANNVVAQWYFGIE